ncbi:MAG TPA: hypothetical protein VHU41_09290, partial [Thermoanaerobaculia bacterium]|nr:hypothetical protein [Thermoanaerobaculia bacterium]
MRFRPVLVLSFAILVSFPAFARPKPIPIISSNIGAAASSNPSSFLRVGSKVFFAAEDGVHGPQPWVTDGTAAGTQRIGSAGPSEFIGAVGSSAIFQTAESTGGQEFWKTDGTAAGTVKLLTIPTTGDAGWYVAAVFADTRFYMLVQLSYSGPVELYVSDGTAAGTRDIGKFPAHLSPTPVGVNGFLYFLGQDATVGPQLWVSDGTFIGTHMVQRDFECPGPSCGVAPTAFLRASSKAMFLTAGGLWTIGDRGSTIQQIASIADPELFAYSPTAARAYFAAKNTLWSTDGTAAGTIALDGVPPAFPLQMLDDGRIISFASDGSGYSMWT